MRGPICEDAAFPVLHHSEHDAHTGWKFARQITPQQRFDGGWLDRGQGREIPKCRHGHLRGGLRTHRERTH